MFNLKVHNFIVLLVICSFLSSTKYVWLISFIFILDNFLSSSQSGDPTRWQPVPLFGQEVLRITPTPQNRGSLHQSLSKR